MIRKGADLFCGAGGTSAGYLAACAAMGATADLLAVNHWPRAIATHELNHRGVRHLCESLENVKPRDVIPSGHLHLLCASPECTHHSRAAGGRPRNDQSRATAWHVCNWLADLNVDAVLIENVPEFVNWGPLRRDGKPNKRKKGQHFQAFQNTLGNLGYNFEWRYLVAADFGDPTTRERFFLMGWKKRAALPWPAHSHAKNGGDGLPRWRSAREIIDWDLKGKSIFGRKKALSPNTIRRIAAGLRKFGGVHAEPFLVMLYGTNDARSVERPAPTITAGGNHIGLAEPFIMSAGGPRVSAIGVSNPMNTVLCRDHMALVEPFIVPQFSDSTPRSVDRPLGGITTTSRGVGLVEPFIAHTTHHGKRPVHGMDQPLPTVTGANRGEMALVEPFTTMVTQSSGLRVRSVDEPVQTITTAKGGEIALVQPYIVKYFKTGTAVSLDQPLDTVTTRDRFMLVEPRTGTPVAEIDILFRMLQPHELAAAQGFPAGYQFTGTREERVKQIGNAVPVNLATALCRSLLG